VVRSHSRDGILEVARNHTQECALEGSYVESGYSLVSEDDRIVMLDREATPRILGSIKFCLVTEGVGMRVEREDRDGEMQTVSVSECDV
jgi:hypothetical protein